MDRPDRKAGMLLILTALASIIAVFGRVAADADQPTLVQSLSAISENQLLYGIGGGGRLVSGVTLFLGAWFLLRTWIIREGFATPMVPILFIVSGIFTAISGATAILLATAEPTSINATIETAATIRWLTGKLGFSAAGAALIVAARYQWTVGGTLKKVAPASMILGLTMLLIWVDLGAVIHAVVGAIFFLWLIAIGTMLATGRTEQLFVEKFNL
jgi:hypothetical protein